MVFLSINQVKSGMKLGKSILFSEKFVYLTENTILNDVHIHKLKKLGVSYLYIKLTDDPVNNPDMISEHTKMESLQIIREVMFRIKIRRSFNFNHISNVVDRIISEICNQNTLLLSLNDIRLVRDYTFAHCLNVCILTVICGLKCGFSRTKLKNLAVGAILHDIGKGLIPAEILDKPGKLTNEEFIIIKQHAELGFKAMQNIPGISPASAEIAKQHHEKFDGTGYPYGLQGDEIMDMARIVTIADVYDALTTDRVYRSRLLPHEAIKIIALEAGQYFDPLLVNIFLQNITPYPIGTKVVLTNGRLGIVKNVRSRTPTRPVIYLCDENLALQEELDLQELQSVQIKDVFI